jgi:hypothetical protein
MSVRPDRRRPTAMLPRQARLRIDVSKWTTAKMWPKVFVEAAPKLNEGEAFIKGPPRLHYSEA